MTTTFFGNPDLYYVFPGYWDDDYSFNPDFTPGEYSGAPLTVIAAQWSTFSEALYSGSLLTTTAGSWSSSGSGSALYAGAATSVSAADWSASGSGIASCTGSALSTLAADWSATGGGAGLYFGSSLALVPASWEAGGGQIGFYTGNVLFIGPFTTLPAAGWGASGSGVASYAGVTLASADGVFTASGGGTASYLGPPAGVAPGVWSSQGSADALYSGEAASTEAAAWEAGVTAFYSGESGPAMEVTPAQWQAAGGAAGHYRGASATALAGLWSALAVGDPLGPPERQPLPPRVTNRGYGSSDITAPSFNRPQYVKHGSVYEPLDLGLLDDVDVFVDGEAGGEHGSNTIFYHFRTEKPLRIGARVLPLGQRSPTRQQPGGQWNAANLHVSVSVTDANRRRLEGGDKVFLPENPLPPQVPRFRSIRLELGFADPGYWNDGYAEDDGLFQVVAGQINYINDATLLQPGVILAAAATGEFAAPPIFEFLPDPRAGLRSPVQPAGAFVVAVSTSQWARVPYTLQVALRVQPELKGVAWLELNAAGRLPLSDAGGEADLQLLPGGFIPRTKALTGSASLQLQPLGVLRRVSPF